LIVSKNIRLFLIGVLLLPELAYGQIPDYYSGVDFSKSSNEIKDQLHKLISDYVWFPFTSASTDVWDVIEFSNQDPDNSDNIRLIYSGESKEIEYRDGGGSSYMLKIYKEFDNGNGTHNNSWNREHVYPISNFKYPIDSDDNVYTDIHNILPVRRQDNSLRGARIFGHKDKTISKGYGITQTGAFYPGDNFIGDIARIIMYMNIRYSKTFLQDGTEVRDLLIPENIGEGIIINDIPEIFLLWNKLDPPDEFEKIRNEIIYNFQQNRNPFIDNPFLATKIWGGPTIEDSWKALSSYEIDIFPNISSSSIEVIRGTDYEDMIKYKIFDMSGKEISTGETIQNVDISYLENGIYILKLFVEDYIISKKIKKI